jgi:hypothetical protein
VASGERETGQGESQERGEVAAEGVREHTTFGSRVRDWWNRFWRWWSWSNVWKAFPMVFVVIFEPFKLMVVGGDDDDIFFAGKNEDDNQHRRAFCGAVVVSMIFGGIHCIGWSFSFPSHTEQELWRISSIAITGVPLILVVFFFISNNLDIGPDIFAIPFFIVLPPLPILYLLSRIVLLVLAFMALRSLPHSALQTVQWTTFMPHV